MTSNRKSLIEKRYCRRILEGHEVPFFHRISISISTVMFTAMLLLNIATFLKAIKFKSASNDAITLGSIVGSILYLGVTIWMVQPTYRAEVYCRLNPLDPSCSTILNTDCRNMTFEGVTSHFGPSGGYIRADKNHDGIMQCHITIPAMGGFHINEYKIAVKGFHYICNF